jgi:hypothetical protein
MEWPEWRSWDLELTPHVLKRMEDRDFTETELRSMLEQATGFEADVVPGRFMIETRKQRRPWQVIVEPDEAEHLLVVVTAYSLPT